MIIERINGERIFNKVVTEIDCSMVEHPISDLKIHMENLSTYLEREYPQYCNKKLLTEASEKTIAIA